MMKLLLMVILPIFLVSLTFSGGFDTLKKARPTPYPTPQNTYTVDPNDASGSGTPGTGTPGTGTPGTGTPGTGGGAGGGTGGSTADQKALQLKTIKFTKHTPAPTNSPAPNCSSGKIAVDLLLDTSGSMGAPPTKMSDMQQAVKTFAAKFSGDSVISVQDFSGPTFVSAGSPARMTYPFGPYNPTTFNQAIDGLSPSGLTYMREGFNLSRQTIVAEKQKPNYAGYKWIFIVLTDGIPTDFSNSQGPVEAQNPTDIANQMKQNNEIDRLITIGLDLTREDLRTGNYASNLLRNIASSPSDFYSAPDPANLQTIYNNIAESICNN